MKYELINPIKYKEPIIQILTNRGIKEEDIEHFLNPTINDIYSPELLTNLKKGAKMLAAHIAAGDDTFIQVDEDCDGYTSSAFLINYLHKFFPAFVENHITYKVHPYKTHGLMFNAVPKGTKLIIIPDAGSSEFELHEKCAQQGMDVLVLDHHEAEAASQYACVINNQLCDYPTKSLSGVGIVCKFCEYLDEIMGTNYAQEQYDLTALGCIADVMDVRDQETQFYVQQGLRNVCNPYIKEMGRRNTRQFGDGNFYMKDVAWYIAPFINAVTRCGTIEEKILLFESMLFHKAYQEIPSTKRGCKGELETLVEQAGRMSTNVKTRQNDLVDAAMARLEETRDLEAHRLNLICLEAGEVDKGLNGLIANKIAHKYQRPCLILQPTDNGMFEGSGRGYAKNNFSGFLFSSGLVEYCAGHKEAFGCGIQEENIELLIKYADEHLPVAEIKYDIDYIWDANHIPENDVLAIADYYYLWGQQIDEPYVVLTNVRLDNDTVNFIGKTGKTLRINIPNGISIIKFYVTDEEKEKLMPDGQTRFANIICHCAKNEWMGNVSPQFILEDIDIKKTMQYYF